MNQRRVLFGVAAVVLLLVVFFVLRPETEVEPGAAGAEGPVAGAPGVTWTSSRLREQQPPEAKGSGDVRGQQRQWLTPRVDRAMIEADGALEVEVRRGGAAVEGAEVRLYWRGERDPNTSRASGAPTARARRTSGRARAATSSPRRSRARRPRASCWRGRRVRRSRSSCWS